jgi:2-methylisocitrate lyase-like PEP mutase family enzyme
MTSRAAKVAAFRALHTQGCFVMPNPWDAGSARLLAGLGFAALATTSAGAAFALGRLDGGIGRAAILANARAIVDAVELPVSADLENGFGDSPVACAETIALAAEAGLAGGSIEDASGDPSAPIHGFAHSVERVAAAAEAAGRVGFVLTARAENFLHGRPDLDDTIRRLQAYGAAGAEVLYAPGLRSLDDIRTLCAAVDRPVNLLIGSPLGFTLSDAATAGVRRISTGGALARAALGALHRAALELRDAGGFGWTAEALPHAALPRLLGRDKEA